MANINLLPWRDELRQEKKQEFFTVIIGFCILGLLCGYIWVSTVQSQINTQNTRNTRLQSEIDALEKQVAEIKDLKQRKAELLDRMKVIQDLQGTRPVIVRYFDELARAVPDGIYLSTVSRTANVLSIEGTAESLSRISSFMRNLEGSDWFDSADVSKIDEVVDSDTDVKSQVFKMSVNSVIPKPADVKGGS